MVHRHSTCGAFKPRGRGMKKHQGPGQSCLELFVCGLIRSWALTAGGTPSLPFLLIS